MTRKTLLGVLFPSLVVLHLLLHVTFRLGGSAPDLLTLALLLAVRETGMGAASLMGFILGLLEDAFSVLAFGANALSMAVVGALGSRTRDLFVGDSLLFFFVYLFSGKLLRDLLFWLVAGPSARGPFVEGVLLEGPLGALYLAGVGLILVVALGRIRDVP